MECHEFKKYMPDFAFNRLEYEKAAKCLNHVKHCASCKDELEIYLIVEKGIRDDSAVDGPFILKDVMNSCFENNQNRISRGRRLHATAIMMRLIVYLVTFVLMLGLLYYLV